MYDKYISILLIKMVSYHSSECSFNHMFIRANDYLGELLPELYKSYLMNLFFMFNVEHNAKVLKTQVPVPVGTEKLVLVYPSFNFFITFYKFCHVKSIFIKQAGNKYIRKIQILDFLYFC